MKGVVRYKKFKSHKMSTKNTRKEISPHNGWIEKEFAFILSQTRSDTAWIDVTNASWRPSKEISKCFSLSLTFPSFSFTLHNYRPCEHLISNQITVAWLKRALFTRSSRHESSDRNLNIFFSSSESWWGKKMSEMSLTSHFFLSVLIMKIFIALNHTQ